MQNEKTMNAANTQRIALVIRQCEDATASAASSTFFRFSKQEFQYLAIQVNQEYHYLITEMFRTLDDIFETYVSFDKSFVTLETQTANREQYSKAYDAIVDWRRYMKDKPEGITILSSFQLKNVRTVLCAWLDLNEMIEESFQKS